MYQGYVVLGFYVVCRQWQDRQWQDTFLYSCSNTFCIFVSFVNNGHVQLFWLLLYQMPYIYWWLMKNYSMPPYICIQFSNLMTGIQNNYSDYCSCQYMSLFMCAGVCVEQQVCVCICCLFLQIDRQLSCILNFNKFTFNTFIFTRCTLCTTQYSSQHPTKHQHQQLTSSQFTLNKTKIPIASNINNTFS